MAAAIIPLAIASTVISAAGSIAEGQAARREANYVARQQEYLAGQQRASSQRAAEEQRRQGRLLESRAQAVAAASGGSATDPSVLDVIGGIRGEGEYRALTALYEGEERARGLETKAGLSRFQGKQAQAAGYTRALGTVLGGGSSILSQKYGGGGPPPAGSAPLNAGFGPSTDYYREYDLQTGLWR